MKVGVGCLVDTQTFAKVGEGYKHAQYAYQKMLMQ